MYKLEQPSSLLHAYIHKTENIYFGPARFYFSFSEASVLCGAGVAFACIPVEAVLAAARDGAWEMLVY